VSRVRISVHHTYSPRTQSSGSSGLTRLLAS